MHCIVYSSKAAKVISDRDLREILETARSNNGLIDVSGMLLYHEGCFIQVLEGVRATVDPLFAQISRDPRHKEIVTLWQGEISERRFGGWTMGFRRAVGNELSGLPGYTDWMERPADAWSPDQNKTMAETFLEAFKRSAERFSKEGV